MPIFSAEQLPLCKEKTLLLFKKKEIDPEDEEIIMLLHSVDDDGKLNVSLSYDDGEVKSFSKDDLFAYKESQYNIYYFPESPVDQASQVEFVTKIIRKKAPELATKGAQKVVKKGIKTGLKETMALGLKSGAAGKVMTPQLAKVVGKKAIGPIIDTVMGTAEAGVATYQHRKKESDYNETGGVKGFSRTRANRKITKEWSSAATGTAGGLGSAALLSSVAAGVGQVNTNAIMVHRMLNFFTVANK